MRSIRDRVGLPNLFARLRVQRHNAAAKGTAWVFGIDRRALFAGRNRNIQASAEEHGRTGDSCLGMGVGMGLPQQLPGCGIHSVYVPFDISEVDQAPAKSGRHSGLHGGWGFKCPVEAACLCIHRIDRAIFAAGINPSAENRGLAVSRVSAGKSQCPLQLQLGDLGPGELGYGDWRIAAVCSIETPGSPAGVVQYGFPLYRAVTRMRYLRYSLGSRKKRRHGKPLAPGELLAHGLHPACLEGAQNIAARELAEDFLSWRN